MLFHSQLPHVDNSVRKQVSFSFAKNVLEDYLLFDFDRVLLMNGVGLAHVLCINVRKE